MCPLVPASILASSGTISRFLLVVLQGCLPGRTSVPEKPVLISWNSFRRKRSLDGLEADHQNEEKGGNMAHAAFAVSLALWIAASPGLPGPGKDSDQARLAESRRRIQEILDRNIIPFWYPRVIDEEHGGYRLHHDGQGKWLGPADKYLVTQARTVWFFSRLSRSKAGKKEHLAAARHGYRFLRDRMWDRSQGGFYWAVDSTGSTPRLPQKHLYGQAFGLYALSEYSRAAEDREARELADRLFRLLESKAHDKKHGGYRESFQRDWTPLPEGTRSYMALPGDLKLMNTHLHLLEALTAYYREAGDPAARERLMELLLIQSNAVVRKDLGACTDRYRQDWTRLQGPENNRISYGHDVENVWLLIEASRALNIPNGPLMDLYKTLMDYSLRHGFDAREGGFFDSGPPGKPADRLEKTWWVQSEALVAFLWMYRLTGESRYLDHFQQTLNWISLHQADWKNGDWHASISGEGKPGGSKAGPWKSPYHNGRAAIRCLEILDDLLENP